MPYTVNGKNEMLDALGDLATHVGLLDAGTPITAVTGAAATDLLTKAGHGLSNGDLVVVTELSGGLGIVAGDAGNANGAAEPLWVIGVSGDDFQLSRTPGGAAVNFTTDITAATVTELVEISGGSPAYARQTIAWNAAALGAKDDSAVGGVFDVPAGATVDYVGFFSALTAGVLYALDKVTAEVFGAQGEYTLTDADLDLNA